MKALDFVKSYISDPNEINELVARIAEQHKGFSRKSVERQVVWKIRLICAAESFLLSRWDEIENGFSEGNVLHLAEETLAFFLADDQEKNYIRELFKLLAENISANITDPVRKKIYGRTLYGVQDAQVIEEWVQSNATRFLSIVDDEEILDLVLPLLTEYIHKGVFRRFDNLDVLKEIAHGWIDGKPFSDLLDIIRKRNAKMVWGSRRRRFNIDHVVEICEGAFAYDGALLIGALCEFIEILNQEGTGDLISRLQNFQKRLKYGLPTETIIVLYELGFSDRVVAQELVGSLNLSVIQKEDVINTRPFETGWYKIPLIVILLFLLTNFRN